MEYDYQLKGNELKVKVISVDWDVKAIRSDNGKEDIFPLMYFKKHFYKIS